MGEDILGIGNMGTGGSFGSGASIGISGPNWTKDSDKNIEEDVNKHIASHSDIPPATVHAEVKDGIVILSGTVLNKQIKTFLADEIEVLTGVHEVKNDIQMSDQSI